MQFPAQIQATIELLDAQIHQNAVADRLLNTYFRQRRYIGSKDRQVIATHFYQVMRQKLLLTAALKAVGLQVNGRTLWGLMSLQADNALASVYTGEQYQPKQLTPDELKYLLQAVEHPVESFAKHIQLNVPEWLFQKFARQYADATDQELLALNQEAPVDLRVNTLKTNRDGALAQLRSHGIACEPCAFSPQGIRLVQRTPITNLDLFKQGNIDVQDEGSQLLALIANPKAGHKVIDFCAGAGGKTLAMAAMMENKGTVLACDINAIRLKEASKRARRAGVFNTRTLLLNSEHDKALKRHKSSADVVLVDAPCSGTGAWRRNPDARFNLTEERFVELLAIQASILESAAKLVKPGGKLIYATCSMLQEENEHQVDKFIKNNNLYKLINPKSILDMPESALQQIVQGEYLAPTPHRTNTDGFFAAVLQRT